MASYEELIKGGFWVVLLKMKVMQLNQNSGHFRVGFDSKHENWGHMKVGSIEIEEIDDDY